MKGNFNSRRKDHGNSANGSSNGSSNNGQFGGSNGFYESAETTRNFNDRFDYLLTKSIGSEVIATVTSAVKYSGVLVACNLESNNGLDIVLKYPQIVDGGFADNIEELTEQLGDTLLIHGADVGELELKGIDFAVGEKLEQTKKQEVEEQTKKSSESQEGKVNGGFKTDVDISRGKGEVKERELQKWTPDVADESLQIHNQTLEESSGTWDQFSVNEKKFGVKSTFDEHLYTTKINKNDPNYEKRLKEAERIAKEIESQGSAGNIHIAEDRGHVVDDSGLDEEDLYSGVDRRGNELLAALKTNAKPSPTKPSKYVAPTLRDQPHNVDPAIISSITAKNHANKQASLAIASAKEISVHRSATPSSKVSHADISTKSSSKTSQRAEAASKKHISKEAQIEELKKFSQKFKVPYDVPEDLKGILKNSSLKSDPSLPPKPSDNAGSKPSLPGTPVGSKPDLRKNLRGAKLPSQSQTPIHSPSLGRANVSSKRRNTLSFFGSKAPQPDESKKQSFYSNFNMFIKAKQAYDEKAKNLQQQDSENKSMEPFFIEKPYFTAPTWFSTVDQSYKSLFPDERSAIQRAQINLQRRQMNSINAAATAAAANQQMGVVVGNMMRFPMGPGGSPNPMMDGMAGNMGMYMPLQPQPMFYPSMPHMMSMMSGEDGGGSPSPQTLSPHMPPAYLNNAPGSPAMGAYGYPGMQFQPMTGGGNGNYRHGYHHHGGQGGHGHRRNNHDNH
ncbi:hypothetical protein HG537_0E04610 [Torulaspora globosa]|uniref:LsmAD domain-containing protein n=1 Tax=Torulaspora globosa TaxID=48254 RepID=A0A7H9HW19_9SACH|nr:hypothetical protein HG537_0E04610 [Torulaspora sp. CBS 2947]